MGQIRPLYFNKEIRHYRLGLLRLAAEELYVADSKLTVFTTSATSSQIIAHLRKLPIQLEIGKVITIIDREGFSSWFPNFYFSFDLLRLVLKSRFTVVIGEGVAGLYVSILPFLLVNRRVGVISSFERTMHTERNAGLLKNLYFRVFNTFFRPFYLINGRATAELLVKRGVRENRWSVPNLSLGPAFEGLSLEDFQHSLLERCRTLERGYVRVIWVGQLIERKNVDALNYLIRQAPNFGGNIQLSIYGDGPEKPSVLAAIHASKAEVLFCEQAPPSDIMNAMLKSHILFLPTAEDNFALVGLEALAMGVEVFTTPFNGMAEELKAFGIGVVGDSNDLVRAVGDYALLCDVQRFSEQSMRSYKRGLDYRSCEVVKNLLRVIKSEG